MRCVDPLAGSIHSRGLIHCCPSLPHSLGSLLESKPRRARGVGGVPWEFCSSPFLGGWGRGLMWRESGLPRDQAGVWGASMCEYL